MAKKITTKNSVLKRGYHRMTLDFGNTYSDGTFHKGIDLTGKTSVDDGYDDIVAFADGEVVTTGYLSDTGYWVRIRHTDGIITRYMHMKSGSIKVKVGDRVKKGQVIGYMGSTGNSTGRHLHFDISFAGDVTSSKGGTFISSQNRTYVDPKPYLAGSKTLAEADKPSLGTYVVTENVNVRKGAGTNYSRVYYSQFTLNAKAQVKKLDKNCPDCFPKGIKLTIKEVKQASNGKWWGRCPSGWVCMSYLMEV